jgi:acyl dehydratase
MAFAMLRGASSAVIKRHAALSPDSARADTWAIRSSRNICKGYGFVVNAVLTPVSELGRNASSETRQMNGLHFEELEEGQLFDHPIRRTVTEMDNTLFSALTYNPQPLHIDRHFCATETEFGQPLMNSYFTLGLMVGIAVNDMSLGTTVANLGMTEVKFPAPVFHGDTLHVRTTVLGKRESKSRPEAGIIELKHEAYNQDDTLVATCTRQVLTRRKRAD